MDDVCESLAGAKELPRDTPVHVIIELNRCSVLEFVVPFELIINNELVRYIEYDISTVNEKSTLEILKKVTLMKKILLLFECFQSLEHSHHP